MASCSTRFRIRNPIGWSTIGATFPKVSSDTTYVEALSTPEYADIKRSESFSHTRRVRPWQPQHLRR